MKESPFFRYFFNYIFHSKTRQRLLFIAVAGLFISSFSLVVIQGVMGGLQKSLVARSKSVYGHHVLSLSDLSQEDLQSLKNLLNQKKIFYHSELTIEVMLKRKNLIFPARLHGVDLKDKLPSYLAEKDFKGLVLGSDLASKLKVHFLDDIQVITPGIFDSLMGEIPRFLTESHSDYVYTQLMEVDEFDVWSRLEFVQNLIRNKTVNQIRIFSEVNQDLRQMIEKKFKGPLRWQTWEEMNSALVWSLNLETKVMLFLFISMSFLVAISITSGLLIFYSKILKDLMSFWILGMSQQKLIQLSFRFTILLSGISCLVGTSVGIALLFLLEKFGHQVMPEIFVERNIPIQIHLADISISYFVPFFIAIIFSYFSSSYFRKENTSFISLVRSVS
jgi:lipoprotein-releasing system permease protein